MTNTNNEKFQMKQLSEIFDEEDIVRCGCGNATFLDWGMQLLDKSPQLKGPRLKEIAQSNSVKICTQCHRAVVHYSGDLYDATSFVTNDAIQQVIQSQASPSEAQKVPVKAGY